MKEQILKGFHILKAIMGIVRFGQVIPHQFFLLMTFDLVIIAFTVLSSVKLRQSVRVNDFTGFNLYKSCPATLQKEA